jgi:hypothetical protein
VDGVRPSAGAELGVVTGVVVGGGRESIYDLLGQSVRPFVTWL